MIGVSQLLLIFIIVLVLFGAGKIPTVMKDLGSGLRAFKKGIEGEEEIDLINNDVKLAKKSKNKKVINNKKKVSKNKPLKKKINKKKESSNKNIKKKKNSKGSKTSKKNK